MGGICEMYVFSVKCRGRGGGEGRWVLGRVVFDRWPFDARDSPCARPFRCPTKRLWGAAPMGTTHREAD